MRAVRRREALRYTERSDRPAFSPLCGSGGTADALASGASWSNPVGVQIPPSAPLDSASPIGEASLVAGPLRLSALPRGRPASPIGAPSWPARFGYPRSLAAGPLRLSALPRGRAPPDTAAAPRLRRRRHPPASITP